MFREILMILLILQTPWAKVTIDNATTGTEKYVALAKCALLVTKRFISPKTNTLVVRELYTNCKNESCRLLDYYLKHYKGTTAIQLSFAANIEPPWSYYVFLVDDNLAFNEFCKYLKDSEYEREFYFLVILMNTIKDQQQRHDIKLEIFRTCANMKVLNVVIMEQMFEDVEIIKFYTYSLYTPNCDMSIKILQINRFQNGRLEKNQLFPLKLLNFRGCTFNVTTFLMLPWGEFNGDPYNVTQKRDLKRLTGIEGMLFRLLAEVLNFTANLSFAKERGKINMRENSTGGFADLEALTSDIAFAGYSITYDNRSKFSTSRAYLYTPHIFVVCSDLDFGSFQQLANPFQPKVWCAIGIAILLALATVKIINHKATRKLLLGNEPEYSYINLFMIILGNPIKKMPRSSLRRILLMFWLLLIMIIRSAYQGKLYDSLRASRRVAFPKNVLELIQNDYSLLSSTHVDYYPVNRTIIMTDLMQQLHEVQNSDRRLTTVITPEILGYYNFMHRNSSRLSYVAEPVYTIHMSLFFQKYSLLKPAFDKRIQDLLDFGITKHVTAVQYGRKEFQMNNVENSRVLYFRNTMLHGVYFLFGISICIAIILFILEMLSGKIKKLKSLFDKLHRQTDR